MLKIDNENNITITKGDTLTLTLNLKKDGQCGRVDSDRGHNL